MTSVGLGPPRRSEVELIQSANLEREKDTTELQKGMLSTDSYILKIHPNKVLPNEIMKKEYTVKKRFASFPSPAGMSLPNSPCAGIMTS